MMGGRGLVRDEEVFGWVRWSGGDAGSGVVVGDERNEDRRRGRSIAFFGWMLR